MPEGTSLHPLCKAGAGSRLTRQTEVVIPIYMALAPVPFAIAYIWRTGLERQHGLVGSELGRATATGGVVGSLIALVLAAVFTEDGFPILAVIVIGAVVAWLWVALGQGEDAVSHGDIGAFRSDSAASLTLQRAAMFSLGLIGGAALGVLPWVALVAVLRSL